ncbi:MAG: hypothetical protein A3G25_10830 [Betaproteobacteria bacterium RIFCSPLOWO2_12_FULL_63_13]|nr:MAG: hypothetical protein A3H32_03070 [Betaproteobacteria bacterium RIFCSPLOWO2_02_FULL_63_19]OGA49665.1 MAG: hypothetical protein A3G25_10830 [Betaproteobacteria bacterium RIFCSPLOWO2_12_FULL_63_13]
MAERNPHLNPAVACVVSPFSASCATSRAWRSRPNLVVGTTFLFYPGARSDIIPAPDAERSCKAPMLRVVKN